MYFTEEEKAELRAVAMSETMRADSDMLRAMHRNPFVVDGKVDCDSVIEFLDFYNEFLNHPMKPHWTFIEKNMKL